MQGEESNVDRINQVIDIDTMRCAKKVTVIQGKNGKQQEARNLSDILYEKYLKSYKEIGNTHDGRYRNIFSSVCFHDFGEVEETYFDKEGKKENVIFDIIKTSEEGKVLLIVKSIPENGELIIPSSVYDKDKKEYKITYIDERSNANYATFEGLKTLKFTGDFDKLETSIKAFTVARTLQTVEINGNIENLTIRRHTFYSGGIKTLTIKGKVGSLNIENDAFRLTELENVTIDGNIRNLTIEKDVFCICKALKNLIIRGNVKKFNLGSEIVYDSSKAKIFLPEDSKNEIPESFKNKDKIIFYDITDDDTLHLKVNEAVSEISLDKETLETLGGNFQNLQAKNLNEEIVEMTMI